MASTKSKPYKKHTDEYLRKTTELYKEYQKAYAEQVKIETEIKALNTKLIKAKAAVRAAMTKYETAVFK